MSHKIDIPSKDILEKKYNQYGVSISTIARDYSTSTATIRKWLRSYKIPLKTHQQAAAESNAMRVRPPPDKEIFTNDFISMSIDDMETKYGVGQCTIYAWQKLFNLEPKDHSTACKIAKAKQYEDIQFEEHIVKNAYDLHHNLTATAEYLGISTSHLKKLCKRYDIEIVKPWRSVAEMQLFDMCIELAPDDEWITCDRKTIYPLELDILNTDKKIAIEYCGSYWHSESYGNKARDYHRKKYLLCRDAGIKLITVFEFDDVNKIQMLLKTMLGRVVPINARDTIICHVESKHARIFYETHHISGFIGANTHLGLKNKHTDELMMMASFGIARNKKHTYECMRMASHSDYRIRGGASKLFKYFVREMNRGESLITYADLRFGDGGVYEYCGMSRLKDSPPNYWYFHKDNTSAKKSRQSFQKHKLHKVLRQYDETKTEYVNMRMNGYDRIWDCGNAIYELKKES